MSGSHVSSSLAEELTIVGVFFIMMSNVVKLFKQTSVCEGMEQQQNKYCIVYKNYPVFLALKNHCFTLNIFGRVLLNHNSGI